MQAGGAHGLALVAMVASLLAACASSPEEDRCGATKVVRERIVNGSVSPDPTVVDLTPGQMLSIGYVDLEYTYCTGTLVSWNTVLTAAHCLSHDPSTIAFVVGEVVSFHSPALRVGDVHIHPLYDPPYYDVAVLEIIDDTRVLGMVPVQVNLDEMSIVGGRVQAVGYGITDPAGGRNDTRYWTVLDVVYENEGWYVGSDEPESGVCSGDSGGPMLFAVPGVGVRVMGELYGGGGDDCLGEAWYTRTDLVADWLAEFVPTGPCGIESREGRCEGTVAVWCEDDVVVSEDCGEGGLECAPDVDGNLRCVEPCGGETYEGRCDGDLAIWCEGSTVRTSNCPFLGRTCGQDAEGRWRCLDECERLGREGECRPGEAVWCEDGAVTHDDCRRQGLVCAEDSGGLYRCMDECEALGFEGECEGDVARWCDHGSVRERDCAACEQECGWTGDVLGYYCL